MVRPIIRDSEYYRECLYCGEEFMTDHLSRKFCKGKSCHDKYHNRRKREIRKKMSRLIELQYHNFNVLDNFFNTGKHQVTYEELIREGFYIRNYVERRKLKGGEEYALLFIDYALIPVETNAFKIIRHETGF